MKKTLKEKPLILIDFGDFVEMFGDDALVANDVTGRRLFDARYKGKDTFMCGVPAAIADEFVKLLEEAGYEVIRKGYEEDKRGARSVARTTKRAED